MRATVMYGAGDVRVENVPDARLSRADRRPRRRHPRLHLRQRSLAVQVDGARARPAAAWATRPSASSRRSAPTSARVKPGDLVVTPFAFSDGTCVFCHEGLQTSCLHGGFLGGDGVDGGQGEAVRVPQADGTLVVLPVGADDALMPSLLTLSDVMGTGHHAALARQGRPRQDASPSSATARSACAA